MFKSVLGRFVRGVVYPSIGYFGTQFFVFGGQQVPTIKNQLISLAVGGLLLAGDKWFRDFAGRSGIPTP